MNREHGQEWMMKTLSHASSRLVLLAGVAVLASCASVPPPTEQMAVSRAALSDAQAAGAYEYAPVEMRTANEKLTRATAAMNEKDYVTARRLAEQAEADAKLAAATSNSAKAQRALDEVQASIRTLQNEITRQTR
jgi:hypothetical protein